MDQQTVVVALFVASAVSAVVASFEKARSTIAPRVEKLAVAVAFAAAAFAVQVSDILK